MCVNRKLTRVILVVYAQSADCKCNPFTPPPAHSQCGGDTRSQTTGYSHFHSCHVIELVVTDEEVAVSSCLEGACTS